MPSYPKSARLIKKKEFDRLRDPAARSAGNRHFVMRWLSGEKRRLGLAVSTKVGKAAVRNKIKRVAREYFRNHPESFPLGDLVIIAKPTLAKGNKKLIRQALEDLLGKTP